MQKQVEPKDDGRSALPPYGHDEPGVVILTSPLRRRGPRSARPATTARRTTVWGSPTDGPHTVVHAPTPPCAPTPTTAPSATRASSTPSSRRGGAPDTSPPPPNAPSSRPAKPRPASRSAPRSGRTAPRRPPVRPPPNPQRPRLPRRHLPRRPAGRRHRFAPGQELTGIHTGCQSPQPRSVPPREPRAEGVWQLTPASGLEGPQEPGRTETRLLGWEGLLSASLIRCLGGRPHPRTQRLLSGRCAESPPYLAHGSGFGCFRPLG